VQLSKLGTHLREQQQGHRCSHKVNKMHALVSK
jgi:hypothetical protein